ncbi:Beta-amyrin 28-monooxygenase [Camellia lanceoleosa]|uniref:Beta-amyrin 28-monooxygenase n=1 Tax=Camellia lanceoleosa TaxID=1840588 RepID=A0ACC0GJ59_9ERIC|nr:Beta-amyrin 28-monooxygenase [Camellia lanceoleosa]
MSPGKIRIRPHIQLLILRLQDKSSRPPTVVFAGAAGNKFLFSNENRLVQAWWPSSVYKVFPSSTQTSSKQEADIADKILGLLIAGHDTASSTCASIVMFLAELPHVYQRVYEGTANGNCVNQKLQGIVELDDIKKMKYSWNVAC